MLVALAPFLRYALEEAMASAGQVHAEATGGDVALDAGWFADMGGYRRHIEVAFCKKGVLAKIRSKGKLGNGKRRLTNALKRVDSQVPLEAVRTRRRDDD